MNSVIRCMLINVIWLGLDTIGYAQAPGVNQIMIPFSDPARPGTVDIHMISGSISVKGYGGKDVILDPGNEEMRRRERASRAEAEGLKRIPNLSAGLGIEEEGNVISIRSGPSMPLDIALQVPTRTTLKLKTVNGDIKAEQVQGEIEVNAINGAVTLTQISGSVVAHALNGNLKVTMGAVDSGKPMSFSSLRGDIDVALPPDIKANLSMKSDQGEIYSDFDIKLDSSAAQLTSEDSRSKGGKYRIRMDRTTKGTINGGGPELQFKTFTGNIYIRKSPK